MESGVIVQDLRETYQGWKRERSSMDSPDNLRDRGFERELDKVSLEHEEDSKLFPTMVPKCRLGKSRTNHQVVTNKGHYTQCHLDIGLAIQW
jgi:hypothetical protein